MTIERRVRSRAYSLLGSVMPKAKFLQFRNTAFASNDGLKLGNNVGMSFSNVMLLRDVLVQIVEL